MIGVTPVDVELARAKAHVVIHFEKDGCAPVDVAVKRTISGRFFSLGKPGFDVLLKGFLCFDSFGNSDDGAFGKHFPEQNAKEWLR